MLQWKAKISTHRDCILVRWRQILRYVSKTYGMMNSREKNKGGKRDGEVAIRTSSRVEREGLAETLVLE